MLPEHGIVSFIRMKLKSGVAPEDIKGMLIRAGFHSGNIDQAFRYVQEKYTDSHQDVVASHDFLPDLSKQVTKNLGVHVSVDSIKKSNQEKSIPVVNPQQKSSSQTESSQENSPEHHTHSMVAGDMAKMFKSSVDKHFVTHKGLFKGRLRRKDFTLGFIFFFAVGYVALSLSAVTISILSPELWSAILGLIEHDTNGVLLITVPVILAPITVMMLSLITRRLHNLGLPGSLSWLFLVLFVPLDVRVFPNMWFLYIALGILFVLLLAKQGVPEANQYGDFPKSKGSFFKRIFNV